MTSPITEKSNTSDHTSVTHSRVEEIEVIEAFVDQHPDTQSIRRRSESSIVSSFAEASAKQKENNDAEIAQNNVFEELSQKNASTDNVVEVKNLIKDFMVRDTSLSRHYSYTGLLPESKSLMKAHEIMNSNLLTNMIGYVIRLTADELKLIGTTYTQGKGDTRCSLAERTLQEKCTKPLFELHDYPTYLLGKDEMAYSFYKFEVDRCFIEKLLLSMSKEILRDKSYSGFVQILKKVIESTEEEDNFLGDTYYTKTEINNIREARYQDKQMNKIDMATLNAMETMYKNQLQDLERENNVKEEYVNKWELSRNTQNHIMYKKRIKKLECEILDYRSKISRENRVNMEVERYTQLVHIDTQSDLVRWSERYDTELEEKDIEIQNLKVITQDMSNKLAQFKIEYEKRVKLVEEGRKMRDKLLLKKELLAKQEKAALKIQAWWRGVRVRKGIGQMKKKKKKGGKNAVAKGKGAKGKK